MTSQWSHLTHIGLVIALALLSGDIKGETLKSEATGHHIIVQRRFDSRSCFQQLDFIRLDLYRNNTIEEICKVQCGDRVFRPFKGRICSSTNSFLLEESNTPVLLWKEAFSHLRTTNLSNSCLLSNPSLSFWLAINANKSLIISAKLACSVTARNTMNQLKEFHLSIDGLDFFPNRSSSVPLDDNIPRAHLQVNLMECPTSAPLSPLPIAPLSYHGKNANTNFSLPNEDSGPSFLEMFANAFAGTNAFAFSGSGKPIDVKTYDLDLKASKGPSDAAAAMMEKTLVKGFEKPNLVFPMLTQTLAQDIGSSLDHLVPNELTRVVTGPTTRAVSAATATAVTKMAVEPIVKRCKTFFENTIVAYSGIPEDLTQRINHTIPRALSRFSYQELAFNITSVLVHDVGRLMSLSLSQILCKLSKLFIPNG